MKTFQRTRHIAASPEVIWPLVDDVTRWPEWFVEAERAEILSGDGIGRKQRMFGHARGHATEIDSVVIEREPERLLRWRHEQERVDGKVGSVVFAKEATAEVTIAPDGTGALVTYRLMAEPGTLVNTFMLTVLAPGPIGRSFEASLARLAKITES